MRHLARAFIVGFALISAAFVAGPVKANIITIETLVMGSTVERGTLSDGGASVTFLGYTAPLTLDNTAPFTAVTTLVNPADEATLTPIANTWFGTNFAVSDDNRTNIVGSGDLVVFDIATMFFSLTVGQQSTAFFQNISGDVLHLTYTAFSGVAGGLSHFDQFGVPVPGPVVGAGLPGLALACGGLILFARRRLKSLVA